MKSSCHTMPFHWIHVRPCTFLIKLLFVTLLLAGSTAFVFAQTSPAQAHVMAPQAPSGTTLLYRLHGQVPGMRLYTTSVAEMNNAINVYGYIVDGTTGYVYPSQFPGTTALYRLHDPNTDARLYTTSVTEMNNAINVYGYIYDGITAYIYPSQVPGTTELYRLDSPNLVSPGIIDRNYTISANEAYIDVHTYHYILDAPVGYVYPS